LGRARVRDFASEPIGADHGFTATLARVTLHYDEPESDAPATLVAKCPAFANEVRTYREFGAELPVARYYGGTAGELLLIEDLPGRPGDAVGGCDADDAELVLSAMARMHATWWESPPAWPRRVGADPRAAQANHEQRVPMFLSKYGDRITTYQHALVEALKPHYGGLFGRMAEAPVTFLHGDLHLDNVIFDADAVYFLDWENPAAGRAVFDLAWFFFTSVRTDERRAHEERLLRGYHGALGVDGYPYDRFRHDLREALAILFGATVNGIGKLDPAACVPRQREWIESVFEPGWLFTAAEDHRVHEVCG